MSFQPAEDSAPPPSEPPTPPPRTVVSVSDDALPEEPTVPIWPILVAADGKLVLFPSDRGGRASGR